MVVFGNFPILYFCLSKFRHVDFLIELKILISMITSQKKPSFTVICTFVMLVLTSVSSDSDLKVFF